MKRMFNACCVCDPKQEEGSELNVERLSEQEGETWPVDAANHSLEPSVSPDISKPLTLEQKQIGKSRLIFFVKAFSRAAMSEQLPCTLVDHVQNELRPDGSYMLDRQLECLITEVDGKRRVIRFSHMIEIFQFRDLFNIPKLYNYLRLPAISSLSDEEKSRLILIEYVDDSKCLRRLCLLLYPINKLVQAHIAVSDPDASVALCEQKFGPEEVANTVCQCLRVFKFSAEHVRNSTPRGHSGGADDTA